ncbi:phage tail tape measure protein [Sulfuriflexus mobilis]|uniref:phage tail tape measure protein n=1 Tax=Sulfuriflexus mobilis TaxID=1811807 RepID=UPI001558F4C9|nr:phage tail tape measure protein [Sulfuriflexus mobilis]
MRLYLESTQFRGGLRQSGREVTGFTGKAKRELGQLKRMFGGIKGQLASLGVAFGGVLLTKQSAQLDKSLTQLGQTAGEDKKKVRELRAELFRMTQETGQGLDDLQGGYNNLIQAGLSWEQSLATIDAINPAMAVTSAKANVLASGLTVAAEAFDFDLSKPGLAVTLLDKMVVAGRLGNAELEDLSSIFARVGVNAKTANLSFDETLGFLEQLSLIERAPERLATLADSTLRLFTNETYKRNAQKKLKVDFYNDDGSSRGAFDVLKDIQAKYKTLKSDRQRAAFIQAGFGQTDLDTKKGLRTLLSGNNLQSIDGMVSNISQAGGTIKRDLSDALDNSIDQTGRLKAALREAADEFVSPINSVISESIKFGLDKKENGGLGLDGKEIIGGGIGLLAGTALAARYGGKAVKAIGGKLFGTAGGVATGKALEAAAGVTPVYVVNMPSGMGIDGLASGRLGAAGGLVPKTVSKLKATIGLLGGVNLKSLSMMGAGALSTAGLAVGAAGAAGYGAGTLANDYLISGTSTSDAIGEALARIAAFFGNDEAQAAIARTEKYEASLKVTVDDERVRVTRVESSKGFNMDVDAGMVMAGP